MLVKVYGAAVYGIEAIPIRIEVNIDKGIAYHLVGLPDSAIKESSYRISAALKNSGYRMPGKKITINLAPADLRKEGSAYDLVMAIGILAASEQIESPYLQDYIMMGELSLDGDLRPLRGILPIAIMAKNNGFKGFIVPSANFREASVVEGIDVIAAKNIEEVVQILRGPKDFPRLSFEETFQKEEFSGCKHLDFEDVKGQEAVKRCLEIAAAGGHNVLMIGPPGSGKSMLAKRLPSILPPMTRKEALETTKIHSVAGRIDGNNGVLRQRPFRSPHHTISAAALVGGGAYPQPGEISLAHNGVLFLDELPEFKRNVLEVMRQPLEDRQVTLSRSRFTLSYPSSFMLIASMNPNRGGFLEQSTGDQLGHGFVANQYTSRISGPLLDRIDLQIEVPPVPFDKMTERQKVESSAGIRKRVIRARQTQDRRFSEYDEIHCNAQMQVKQLRKFCNLDSDSYDLIKRAMQDLGLSARAYDRILKVARTISDLANEKNILAIHVAEAIQYRSLDRNGSFYNSV